MQGDFDIVSGTTDRNIAAPSEQGSRSQSGRAPQEPSWLRSHWGLLTGLAALIIVIMLPTPEGLPVAGQRMLAVLAFAVIVWMTEAVDYAVSALIIAALMAFLLGLSPSQSAFEKDSQGGFGVIHRASDQRFEPPPDGKEEAARKTAVRH